MCSLLMYTTELHERVGKGRRHHMSKLHDKADAMQDAHGVYAVRTLVLEAIPYACICH